MKSGWVLTGVRPITAPPLACVHSAVIPREVVLQPESRGSAGEEQASIQSFVPWEKQLGAGGWNQTFPFPGTAGPTGLPFPSGVSVDGARGPGTDEDGVGPAGSRAQGPFLQRGVCTPKTSDRRESRLLDLCGPCADYPQFKVLHDSLCSVGSFVLVLVRENDHFILCIKLSSKAKMKDANAERGSRHPPDSAATPFSDGERTAGAAALVVKYDSGSHKNVPCPAARRPLTPRSPCAYYCLVMSLQTW